MRWLVVTFACSLVLAGSALAAPPNDDRGDALGLGVLPARVDGTTADATTESDEPGTSCGSTSGTVWYSVRADRRGPVVVSLEAKGEVDAVVGVFRRARTAIHPVACRATNTNGRVLIAFHGRRDREYLVAVGTRRGQASGEFTLRVARPEPRSTPPGRPFAGAVESTVHPIVDADDAWSYEMERGKSYRINLLPARSCVSVYIFQPRTYRFGGEEQAVEEIACGGYAVFTPGPDGGGRYSLLVTADDQKRVFQPYRLVVAPAELDDLAPGINLGQSANVTGALSGRGADMVDLYRFGAFTTSELDLRLRNDPKATFEVSVHRPTGERIELEPTTKPGRTILRRRLDPGHYYLAVRSRARSGGDYSLSLRVRGITATSMLVGGQQFVRAEPGAPQVLSAAVSAAGAGGRVRFQVDSRDPFSGWQYAELLLAPVGASGLATAVWTPPTFGHFRIRARFLGTNTAASSESSYTRIFASEPLVPG